MSVQSTRVLRTQNETKSAIGSSNAVSTVIHSQPIFESHAAALKLRYLEVRAHSLALAAPLSAEDQCIQSMPDASPTKWHLAHTTWFFETLLLQVHTPRYEPYDTRFHYLFNSYYEALGPRHPRPQRGLLTRPSLEQVLEYRQHVDEGVMVLLNSADSATLARIEPILTLGLNHEQQHQELILTDILHALSCNPLLPAYRTVDRQDSPSVAVRPAQWLVQPSGIHHIGHAGRRIFVRQRNAQHIALIQAFAIADRLVTCGEFASFVADGGYRRAALWLADGWNAVQAQGWSAPAYWLAPDDPRLRGRCMVDGWHVFGLHGVTPLDTNAPVANISFYEACAYAEWTGARLPTEFEWEVASASHGIAQIIGHAWQWTRSAYDPYPGFRPLPGVIAEYNGKFMVGQLVLRGGSIATPAGHTRPTYRNFFPPSARWQFSGVRLARDIDP